MDKDALIALKTIIMLALIIPTWAKIKRDCKVSSKITNQLLEEEKENAIIR